jgi:hypothetical protein
MPATAITTTMNLENGISFSGSGGPSHDSSVFPVRDMVVYTSDAS